MSPPGALTVVGTPIGNLEDLSVRASKALAAADVIYCEDTRRTRALLSALGISSPRLVRLDRHNEAAVCASVIAAVTAGHQAVVVTDAGMPTISDPGDRVVAAVAADGLAVAVVPGPCAVSAALALSGLPGSEYRFAGFLPRKGRDRKEALDEVRRYRATTVIYEAANRVARTLADLAAVCGPGRRVAAARELTKLHEEVWRGTLAGAVEWLDSTDGEPRGEWVLVVAGSADDPAFEVAEPTDGEVRAALQERLAVDGADRRDAVAEVAVALGVAKRRVYDLALGLKHEG